MEAKTLGTPTEESPTTKEEVSFWDVMPYPSILISIIIGVIIGIFASSSFFNAKYGTVIAQVPIYEKAKERAEANTLEIKRLVKENEEYVRIMGESSDKIVEWGKGLKVGSEKVVAN